jgi:hypothetical protein
MALGPHPQRELTLMLALPPSLANNIRELRRASRHALATVARSAKALATVARSAKVARLGMAAGAAGLPATCPTYLALLTCL